MKHWFVAFPSGLPGAGLLLLRGSTAVFLAAAPSQVAVRPWEAALLYLASVMMGVGIYTRLAAGLGALALVALVWPIGQAPAIPFLTQAAAAVAAALLGAGAYSIDARLFGRRTVHLAE